MLNKAKEPKDYVLATGENHSVRDFVELAFNYVGIDNWKDYVKIDEKLIRLAEVYDLRGDYSKAKRELGWEPKTPFKELVSIMVQSELDRLSGK